MKAQPNHILMMCPKLTCRKVLNVPETARGKSIRCRNCGTVCQVPSGSKAEPNAKAG